MAEEPKKPIILHVESDEKQREIFLTAMRNVAEVKKVDTEIVESQIVQISNYSSAKDYIKQNGKNIVAVITDNIRDDKYSYDTNIPSMGAYILKLAEEYNPNLIKGWSSYAHPNKEEQDIAGITFKNYVGSDNLSESAVASSSVIADYLIRQPSSQPSRDNAKANGVLILSQAIDALNIEKAKDQPAEIIDSQQHSKNVNLGIER